MHWTDKCPHKLNYQSVNISEEVSWDTENESESEEINIVLITEEIEKNKIFIAEASKLAVVDTGCTKKVTGKEWYMNYRKDLLCELKSQIKSVESNIIENVVQSCDTCARFKRTPRPLVGLSKAKGLNLYEMSSGLYYLHITDEFTRYSNAVIIKKKSRLAAFIKNWLSIFGAPKRLFTDNGGEFISDEFYEMCERFNIKVITTPSYSPWSNGLCGWHSQFLTNMLDRICDDVKCDYVALAWAVILKNALINHNGFGPAKLLIYPVPLMTI